jgi:hypothetical protein
MPRRTAFALCAGILLVLASSAAPAATLDPWLLEKWFA